MTLPQRAIGAARLEVPVFAIVVCPMTRIVALAATVITGALLFPFAEEVVS